MDQNTTSAIGSGNQTAGTAHESIDPMTGAARPAVDRFASGAHQAVDRFVNVASQAVERFGSRSEQFKGSQERMMDEARIYIRNKPATAVGIAVAAGFVLSRILKR